ncbi:MAG TPA: DsbA family protein [Novosphingobium sp.]|nr:DsbA family protein [Novosphingobium sp.]
MQDNNRAGRDRWLLVIGLVAGAGLASGGWYLGKSQAGPPDRHGVETIVREYILAHPEVLPEAMANLQQKEGSARLSDIRGQVEKPFPGAVLGNPEGKVTLVEFADFACGYCRKSVEDVRRLVAKHPDLRVVIREFPILSPQSADAARWGLAAAQQGKYEAFHYAMFAAGQPGPETIEAAARSAGLDLARARVAVASRAVEEEIARNVDMARQLGFSGTPSWTVGDQLIPGAVGFEELSAAIEAARKG